MRLLCRIGIHFWGPWGQRFENLRGEFMRMRSCGHCIKSQLEQVG